MTDIRTSWLMTSSAAVLAVIGIALSYLPRECLTSAGVDASPRVVVLAQLTGAMALAWAILDWMARRQRIGGIYNRPLALANWLHFLMGSFALVKMTTPAGFGALEVALVVPYAVLAIWWGVAVFTSPV